MSKTSTTGKMYGLTKTHKNDNPTPIVKSWCKTAVEFLVYLRRKSVI